MLAIRRILVPTDFSPHADRAVEVAVDLARTFDAEVHLLHCYEINPGAISPYGIAMPVGFDRELRSAAEARLEQVREKVASDGVPVRSHLEPTVPALSIFEVVEEIDADLIVMGTRGLSGIQHVLMGSTAERTVRLAPCPVMVVHADGKH